MKSSKTDQARVATLPVGHPRRLRELRRAVAWLLVLALCFIGIPTLVAILMPAGKRDIGTWLVLGLGFISSGFFLWARHKLRSTAEWQMAKTRRHQP